MKSVPVLSLFPFFLCNNIQVFIYMLSVNMECVFILLRFSFFLNLFFFLLCSFSSSDTTSGGSWWCPSWGGEGSPVRYRPGNFVGLISSELGVRATPPGCSALLCSTGLLLGGRKHSVISALPCYWLLAARCPGIGCSLWWRITSPCHLNKGKNRQVSCFRFSYFIYNCHFYWHSFWCTMVNGSSFLNQMIR